MSEKSTVEDLARALVTATRYDQDWNLERITEELGGQVQYWGLEDYADEPYMLVVHELGRFEVHLPRFVLAPRRRYLLAQALGFYALQVLWPAAEGALMEYPVTFLKQREPRLQQAVWFAQAFLLPAVPVRSLWQRTGGDVAAVAAHFGVGVPLLIQRLRELDLNAVPP